MLGGDRVEDAADERCRRRRASGCSGHQAGHSSRASRTISARTAPNSRSAPARIRSGVSVSERIVWRIFAANRSAPRRPSPSLAGRTTSRRWASKAARAGPGALGRGAQPRQRRAATAASSAPPLRGRQRLVDQLLDAGSWLERRLGLEPADRPPGDADERSRARVEHRRRSPRAGPRSTRGGRPAARTRGREREQAVAEQVDPVERVPGVLAQLGLGEPVASSSPMSRSRSIGSSPARSVDRAELAPASGP